MQQHTDDSKSKPSHAIQGILPWMPFPTQPPLFPGLGTGSILRLG